MSLEQIYKNLSKQLDEAESADDAMKVNSACDLYGAYLENLSTNIAPVYRSPDRRSAGYNAQDVIAEALYETAKKFEKLAERAVALGKELPDPDDYDDSRW